MTEVEEVRYQPVRHKLQDWIGESRQSNAGAIDGFITEAEQAAKDSVSVATLRRRRRGKYGPQPVQFGRKFYYRQDATERWLEEQERAAETAESPRRGRPRRTGR